MSRADLNDRLFGEHYMGVARHYVGDQTSARRHLEQVLNHYSATDHGRDIIRFRDVIRFQTDVQVSARTFLARVLWWQGLADQAVRAAEMSIGEAQATGHALSLCYTLALAACPISLWVGNLTAATRYTATLLDLSRNHSFSLWSAFGSEFQRLSSSSVAMSIEDRGNSSAGLDEVVQSNLRFRSLTGISQLAEALAMPGGWPKGSRCSKQGWSSSKPGCYTPELLRLKGELFLLQGTPAAAETAEGLFRQALDEARRQQALSWELRAATSLARLLRNQGRPADAIACLQPVYDRFTEGFGTADLIAAKQLLDELSGAGRR